MQIFVSLSHQQEIHKAQLMQALNKFLPSETVSYCAELIMLHKLHLHIVVERKSRYGDYSPHHGKGNRISVNHNLSPFEFLLTFIHELSHHTAYVKYGPHHDSHGDEWKKEFQLNMKPFLEAKFFPYDLQAMLAKHMRNPKYSQSADVKLMQVLKKYDLRQSDKLVLNDLSEGEIFRMKNNKISMRKLNKLRTYILCETLDGKLKYKVHSMAEVVRIDL
ncbi:MAG: sprT domain-containing protein [Bacteroidetes bacterium]|nr:sprT domain-containing protein [Bacteroidota bacterium]